MIDALQIRSQFPILDRTVHGKPLVYLDNAATTQKPQVVLDAITQYYSQHNANVHRGVHALSDESTDIFLQSHERVAQFFSAESSQLIFTRNTTEAMNTLAWGLRHEIRPDSVIVTTVQDHHSASVPWQQVALERGARLLALPLDERGSLDVEASLQLLLKEKDALRVIVFPLVSNVLGEINPVSEISAWLQREKIRDDVFLFADAAQAAPHIPVSLSEFGIDGFVFSGHKMYGPMGSGGAILSPQVFSSLRPFLTGGGMIQTVTSNSATFSEDLVDRFTAGTPDVASLVGLAAAVDWLGQWTWAERMAHEHEILKYAWQKLSDFPGVRLVGPSVTDLPDSRIGVLSWIFDRVHAHDVAQILDRQGVAIRSGHHCTMPLHSAMHWQATCRLSVALYNTQEEIDVLITGLEEVQRIFSLK